MPGDPNYYKIETAHNSAVKRFFDSSVPAWYSADGRAPDPNDPNERKCYIVNTAPWYPSFETTGDWTESQTLSGYFKENYAYASAGTGDKQAKWLFTVPTAGTYKVFGWWPASNGNASSASYVVNHSAGSTVIPMNQQVNGGRWNELGEFYFEPNNYSVTLSNDTSGGNVIADAVRISHPDNPPEVIQADFVASTRSGMWPLFVTFSNVSTGDFTSRRWDFGDGGVNTTRDSVDHTYTAPGKYAITLTVRGPLGSSTRTKVGYIVVGNTPAVLQSEFYASNRLGAAPLNVRFRDYGSGNYRSSWLWNFGDGNTSPEQSPTHVYSSLGNYTVKLTVTDANGNSVTETKENYIRAVIFEKSIDNVDYPKTHIGSKVIIYRKEPEISKEELKYSRLLWYACNSGNYYLDTFQHGVVFYTLNTTAMNSGKIFYVYLKAYFEGRSNQEIWQILQDKEGIFDYYDFSKRPDQQQ